MSEKDIVFDKGVLVACPMYKFSLREASHCQLCEFFAGAQQRVADPKIEQHVRYLIGCAFPTPRKLSKYEG